jgi:hypothetical protein
MRGDVNFLRLLRVAWNHSLDLLKSYFRWTAEMLPFGSRTRLSTDLDRLMTMNRKIAFFIAEGDAGNLILKLEAGRTMARGIRSGAIVKYSIPGADHTFSRLRWRECLVDKISAHLASRYRLKDPPRADPLNREPKQSAG